MGVGQRGHRGLGDQERAAVEGGQALHPSGEVDGVTDHATLQPVAAPHGPKRQPAAVDPDAGLDRGEALGHPRLVEGGELLPHLQGGPQGGLDPPLEEHQDAVTGDVLDEAAVGGDRRLDGAEVAVDEVHAGGGVHALGKGREAPDVREQHRQLQVDRGAQPDRLVAVLGAQQAQEVARHEAEEGLGLPLQAGVQLPQLGVLQVQQHVLEVATQGLPHGQVEVVPAPGLGDVAVEAGLVDGVADGVDRGLPGQQDREGARQAAVQLDQQLVALQTGHDLVGDDQRQLTLGVAQLGDELEGGLGVLDRLDPVLVAEVPAQLLAQASSTHRMVGLAAFTSADAPGSWRSPRPGHPPSRASAGTRPGWPGPGPGRWPWRPPGR